MNQTVLDKTMLPDTYAGGAEMMQKLRKRSLLARILTWSFMLLTFAASFAHAIEIRGVIIKKNGGRAPGLLKWQPASKVYVVTDNNAVQVRIPLSDVARVEVKDPPELDSSAKLVAGGQPALAIPNLEKIVKDYEMLGPDIKAARWLAEAYMKQNEPKKAVVMCDKIVNASPSAVSGDLASLYWEALLADNQIARLKKAISDAVASGNRTLAARALIMRGNIEKKQGNLKEALVDGYLRTVVLFQDVKEVQPKALYEAAKCFEALGQLTYVEKMRKKLLAEYPDSPYSQQIKSGT